MYTELVRLKCRPYLRYFVKFKNASKVKRNKLFRWLDIHREVENF